MTSCQGGALSGVRIVEMAGVGPGPFACMMLADHGAEVIRVERPGAPTSPFDVLARNRRRIVVDVKQPDGVALIRALAESADGLVEGYRPGVMERLGLGPDVLRKVNQRLVYGRMTGWGQEGPYAPMAGHDINYIALSGALHAFGRADGKPTPPVNTVGDFGGGGMLLAFGMVSAILAARGSGQGQVIDSAMVDGAALLMSMMWGYRAAGRWRDERGVNALDTGAHYYDTYETADGEFISIGSIEPQFYTLLREKAGLGDEFAQQLDASRWPSLKERLAVVFKTRSRAEWCDLMEGTDVCFAPVLSWEDAPRHPHNAFRRTFTTAGGVTQPSPAPRLAGTPARDPEMPRGHTDTEAVLREIGYDDDMLERLRDERIVM